MAIGRQFVCRKRIRLAHAGYAGTVQLRGFLEARGVDERDLRMVLTRPYAAPRSTFNMPAACQDWWPANADTWFAARLPVA